LVIRLNV